MASVPAPNGLSSTAAPTASATVSFPTASSAGLVWTSTDPALGGAGAAWQQPQTGSGSGSSLPTQTPLGNVTGTVAVDLASASVAWISATLTGNTTFNLTNGAAGGEVYWFLLQDATGGRTVTIGTTSITLSATTASTWQLVKSYTLDGLTFLSSAGQQLLPVPPPTPPGGGTAIWDARIPTGTNVIYTGSGSTTNATLVNYATVQVGRTNPDNSLDTNKRMFAMDASGFSAWSTRLNRAIRHRSFNTDTNNKNTGQQSHPAASGASALNLADYATNPAGNWHIFVGFSIILPDGTQRDDAAFPNPVPGFYQAYEDFGEAVGTSSFFSPQWYLAVRDGANIGNSGGATHGTNYFYMAPGTALAGTSFPALWVDSNPCTYGDTHSHDFIWEIGRSSVASTDAVGPGTGTGGFIRLWKNGVQQTFRPSSGWTLADSGKTWIGPTLTSGSSGNSGPGYTNFDQYWTQNQWSTGAGSGTTPITMYRYPVGAWTTKAAADPTLN